MGKYSLGSIVIYGIVAILFLELILGVFVGIISTMENSLEYNRPHDPLLARIYDGFHNLYSFLKPILTTKEGLAGIIAIDMVLIGFLVEWKKKY